MSDNFINISFFFPAFITRHFLYLKLKEKAEKFAKGKLIDLGCGTKPYEKLFDFFIDSYYGVDYPITADVNYKNQTKADLFVDCTNTGLDSKSFDTLLSTQVMEHIADTDLYLKECYRLLKKGGNGIFTVPFIWECHSEPFDYYRFTKYGLEYLFSKHDFKIISIEESEGAFAALIQTKIISIYNRNIKNIFFKYYLIMLNLIRIPVYNLIAMLFDNLFSNKKLCLNYIIIVEKN